MTAYRLTDAQIASALRAHLPAHARSDVRGRIHDEVAATRQLRPMPMVLRRLTDADPEARRRAVLLVAAALLALGVALAAVVGALLRRDDPQRLTADPAQNPGLFVEQAYAAHRLIPAMTVVARFWDLDEGPVDVQRFVFDGLGRVRHECCDGTVIINTSDLSSTTNLSMGEEIVWVVGPPLEEVAGKELATYSRLDSPECPTDWQYVGADVWVGRPAHHLTCTFPAEGDVVLPPQEYWLDAELGIVLKHLIWGVQLDEDGEPLEPYGSAMEVESITFGDPPPDAFEPPAGLTVMTSAEFNCEMDPSACGSSPLPEGAPAPTPDTAPQDVHPPDLDALVADTLASYAGPPAMRLELWGDRGQPDSRRYSDGQGSYREERAFDAPDGPVVDLWIDDGFFESWPTEEEPNRWIQYGDTAPEPGSHVHEFTLDLPETCDAGWTYLGLDLVLGAEAWHIGCERTEFWIDRSRLLVVRKLVLPDPLATNVEVELVLAIEFGPQPPELFQLPQEAVVEGR